MRTVAGIFDILKARPRHIGILGAILNLEEDLQKIAALRKSLLDDGARPAEDQGYLEMIDRLMDRIRNNG